MAPSIGLNLRVTGYCNQGGRKYMEDVFSVAYQQTEDEKDLEYAFFGIFDGHGGREAAIFAKEHLMDFIVRQKGFWAEDDENVLRAIHTGFIETHQAMWKEIGKWPKTASGLPSTAGTTASIAFIRRGKIFIGHVGDSAIVLGVREEDGSWRCEPLTRDHKPESQEESRRIQQCGGKVICKSGVPRVVWNRPKMGHKGPVRRSTLHDEIPFLAVARSLGDLWSYNSEEDVFVVSPEPDTYVYPIDISKHRCLILGTDGAWNMLSPAQAVAHVCEVERSNEQHMLCPAEGRQWINPSKRLVDKAIDKWNANNLRADNTSIVTVMLDPPGPPRAQVLKRQREINNGALDHVTSDRGSVALVTNTTPEEPEPSGCPPPSAPGADMPPGLSIISRFPNSRNRDDVTGHNLADQARSSSAESPRVLHDFQGGRRAGRCRPDSTSSQPKWTVPQTSAAADAIQCNEVSSSDDDTTPVKSSSSKRVSSKPVLKESRLSRELNALKLDSPGFMAPPVSRRRTLRSQDDHSDTENHRPPHNHGLVEAKCHELNDRIRRMERKVAKKTAQLNQQVQMLQSSIIKNTHNLRSSQTPPPVTRALRPRTPAAPTTPKSTRKRKQPSEESLKTPAKSPRTVVTTKPVVTRSRRAKVLQLKK